MAGGIIDTLNNLDAVDIKSSGVGLNPGAAFRGYRQTLNEHPYSFLSFFSIRGDRNNSPLPLSYIRQVVPAECRIDYDPVTNSASILVAEEDLFTTNADINGINWLSSGEILFSTNDRTELLGEDSLNLVDGAIAAYNLETKNTRPYLLQSELFSAADYPQANINSLHVRSESTDELLSNSASQISFRNRIRVEGNSANQPNKDLTVFGYLHQEDSVPVGVTAEYYASEGDKQFGREVVHYSRGGTTENYWQSFVHNLDWPEEKTGNNPLTDEALSLQLLQIIMLLLKNRDYWA